MAQAVDLMTGDVMQPGDPCWQCADPFDPHAMIPTGQTNMDGGIILCPVKGCLCLLTWGTKNRPADAVAVPNDTIITALRKQLQGES